ncbi:glycosyltransferase family 2 protein [uncultured Muribaculum sp.]|uniref:glycosyltransferase family 2 protein n=1 Tax=uncultured Muribaculum sp. TaxID=1918613 RepID=UPI0025D0B3F2|nr:glycosyltransferase family 2 protein [uncultured Muribaculum sp.]
MNKISVVINTYNAEQHLDKVLESAKAFDEIVVCDMESTDRTIEIAKKHGCRIVTFPKGNHTICEPARNTAIQAASNQWVLVLDADELVPDGMPEYLYDWIGKNKSAAALSFGRINQFMGRKATGGPDRLYRFLRKDKVDWPPTIHSRPVIDGPVEYVPLSRKDLFLIHLDNPTIAERVDKLNTYSSNEVIRRRFRNFGYMSFLFRPLWAFIRTYFIRGAIRDGRRGLIRSYLEAYYQIMMMAKVTEYRWYKW